MFGNVGKFNPQHRRNGIDDSLLLIRSPVRQSAFKGAAANDDNVNAEDEATTAPAAAAAVDGAATEEDDDDNSVNSQTISCGRIKFDGIPIPESAPKDLICEECESNYSVYYCGRCQEVFCPRCCDLCHPVPYNETMHFHEADGHIRSIQPGDTSSIKKSTEFHLPDEEFHEEDYLKVKDLTKPNSLISTKARNESEEHMKPKLKQQKEHKEQLMKYDVHQIVLFNDPVTNQDAYGKIISQYDSRHTINAPPIIRSEGASICYMVQHLGFTEGIEDLNILLPKKVEIKKDENYPILEGIEHDPNRFHYAAAYQIEKRIKDMEGIKRLGPKHHLRDIVSYGENKAQRLHTNQSIDEVMSEVSESIHPTDQYYAMMKNPVAMNYYGFDPRFPPLHTSTPQTVRVHIPELDDNQSKSSESSSTKTTEASKALTSIHDSSSVTSSINPTSMYNTEYALKNIEKEKYLQHIKIYDARHAVLKKMDFSPSLYEHIDLSLYADINTDLQSQLSARNNQHHRPFPAVVRSYEDLLLHSTAQSLQEAKGVDGFNTTASVPIKGVDVIHQHHQNDDYFPKGKDHLITSGHELHGFNAQDIIHSKEFIKNALRIFIFPEEKLQLISERIEETIGKKKRKLGKVLDLRLITERINSVAKAFDQWKNYTIDERKKYEITRVVRVQAYVRRFLNRFTIKKLEEDRLMKWEEQWQELHNQFKYTTADDPYAVTMNKKIFFQTLADANRYAATLRIMIAKISKYLLRKRYIVLREAIKLWKEGISMTFEDTTITYNHFHTLAIDPNEEKTILNPHEFIIQQRDLITNQHEILQQQFQLTIHQNETIPNGEQQRINVESMNEKSSVEFHSIITFDKTVNGRSDELFDEMNYDNVVSLPLRLPDIPDIEYDAPVIPLTTSMIARGEEVDNDATINSSKVSPIQSATIDENESINNQMKKSSLVKEETSKDEFNVPLEVMVQCNDITTALKKQSSLPIGTKLTAKLPEEEKLNEENDENNQMIEESTESIKRMEDNDTINDLQIATVLEDLDSTIAAADGDDGGKESIEIKPSILTIDNTTTITNNDKNSLKKHQQIVPSYSTLDDLKLILPSLPKIFIPHSASGRLNVKNEQRLDYCDFRSLMKGPTFDSCWILPKILLMGSMPWGQSDESNTDYIEGQNCSNEEFVTISFTKNQLIEEKKKNNSTITKKINFIKPKSTSISSITALLLSGIDYFISLCEENEENDINKSLNLKKSISKQIHEELKNIHLNISKIIMFHTNKINIQKEILNDIPEYGKTDPRYEKSYKERLRCLARIELANENIRKIKNSIKDLPLNVYFLRFPLKRDGTNCNINNLLPILWKIEFLLKEKRKIYLYSSDGHGRTGLISSLLLGRLYNLNAYEVLYRIQASHDSSTREQNRKFLITCPQLPIQRKLIYELLNITNRINEGIHIRTQLDPETFIDYYSDYHLISKEGGELIINRIRPTCLPLIKEKEETEEKEEKNESFHKKHGFYRGLSEKQLDFEQYQINLEEEKNKKQKNIEHGNNLEIQEFEQKLVENFLSEQNKRRIEPITMQKEIDYDLISKMTTQFGTIRSSTMSDDGITGTGSSIRTSRKHRRHHSKRYDALNKLSYENNSASKSFDSNIQQPSITRIASMEPLLSSVDEVIQDEDLTTSLSIKSAAAATTTTRLQRNQKERKENEGEVMIELLPSSMMQIPIDPRLKEPSIEELYDPLIFGQSMNVVRRLPQRRPAPAARPNLQLLRVKDTPMGATHAASGIKIQRKKMSLTPITFTDNQSSSSSPSGITIRTNK